MYHDSEDFSVHIHCHSATWPHIYIQECMYMGHTIESYWAVVGCSHWSHTCGNECEHGTVYFISKSRLWLRNFTHFSINIMVNFHFWEKYLLMLLQVCSCLFFFPFTYSLDSFECGTCYLKKLPSRWLCLFKHLEFSDCTAPFSQMCWCVMSIKESQKSVILWKPHPGIWRKLLIGF